MGSCQLQTLGLVSSPKEDYVDIGNLAYHNLSALYNASEIIYDPYSGTYETLLLSGISGDPDYHTGGLTYDRKTNSMLLSTDSATAFATDSSGQWTLANLTGPNNLLKYSVETRQPIYNVPMSSIQAQVLSATGERTAGFQDACFDSHGYAYMIGSFGNVIARVTPSGDEVSLWFQESPSSYTEDYGFTGLFNHGNKLVVVDTLSAGLVTFDTNAEYGVPTYLTPSNLPVGFTPVAPDGFHAPTKHGGRVALWADDYGFGLNPNGTGGIVVLGSLDGWETAQYLGFVSNDYTVTGQSATTSTVQIVDSIYLVAEYFQMPPDLQPKADFPFLDITEQVDQIVRGWKVEW